MYLAYFTAHLVYIFWGHVSEVAEYSRDVCPRNEEITVSDTFQRGEGLVPHLEQQQLRSALVHSTVCCHHRGFHRPSRLCA